MLIGAALHQLQSMGVLCQFHSNKLAEHHLDLHLRMLCLNVEPRPRRLTKRRCNRARSAGNNRVTSKSRSSPKSRKVLERMRWMVRSIFVALNHPIFERALVRVLPLRIKHHLDPHLASLPPQYSERPQCKSDPYPYTNVAKPHL